MEITLALWFVETQIWLGYIKTLTRPPIDLGGKLVLNFDRTTPLFP
eukprot:Gb_31027 [translate_table: standard]